MDPFADLRKPISSTSSTKVSPTQTTGSDPFADLRKVTNTQTKSEPTIPPVVPQPTAPIKQDGVILKQKPYENLFKAPDDTAVGKYQNWTRNVASTISSNILEQGGGIIANLLKMRKRNTESPQGINKIINPSGDKGIIDESLFKAGEYVADKTKTATDILDEDNSNKEAYGNQVLGALSGSIPTLLLAYYGGVPGLGAGIIGNSATNAEDVYNENIKQGKTPEEASKKYQNTFTNNLIISSITTALGVMGKVGGVTSASLKNKAFEYVKDATVDFLEENVEQVNQNINSNKPWATGIKELSAVMAPVSLLMGGVGLLTPGEMVNQQPDIKKKEVEIENDKKNLIPTLPPPGTPPPDGGANIYDQVSDWDKSYEYFTSVFKQNEKTIDLPNAKVDINLTPFGDGKYAQEIVISDGTTSQVIDFNTIYNSKQEAENAIKQNKDIIQSVLSPEDMTVFDDIMFSKKEPIKETKKTENNIEEIKNNLKDEFPVNPFNPGERIVYNNNGDIVGGLELNVVNDERGIMLNNIRAIEKGGGVQALNVLKNIADKYQIPITGTIQPTGTKQKTFKELVSYYKKNGFVVDGKNAKYFPKKENNDTVEAFSKKEDTQEQPVEVSAKEGLKVIKDFQKRWGIEFSSFVLPKLFTGEYVNGEDLGAYGAYMDNTIALSERIKMFTAEHELGHFAFKNMEKIPLFKGMSRTEIYAELRKEYGNDKTLAQLEEHLMEDFEKYVAKQKTVTGKIKSFFDKIIGALKEVFGLSESEMSSIQKFYETAYYGKKDANQDIITFENTGKLSEFMKNREQEFGTDETPAFSKEEQSFDDVVKEYEKEVATQKTTEKSKTKKVIEQNIGTPTKDKVTANEQSLIKTKLKSEGKGFKMGEKVGEKTGVLKTKNKYDPIILEEKRKQELAQLRENILKRNYRDGVLNALRTNIPRKEWSKYMTRVSKLGINEKVYLDILNDVVARREELDIIDGVKREKASLKKDISYIKYIYDIEPILITDIKNQLQIRDTYKTGERAGQEKEGLKSIKDFTPEELSLFKDELNKRIEFRKNNPVNYTDYIRPKEKSTVMDYLTKFDNFVIAPIERRLTNISEVLREKFMSYYFDIKKNNKEDFEKVKPFIELYQKASDTDKLFIDKYTVNRDIKSLKEILSKYTDDVDSVYDSAREVFDNKQKELKDTGLKIGFLSDYFPRRWKPMTRDDAELALKVFEDKVRRKATDEERKSIIDSLVRGSLRSNNIFSNVIGNKFEESRVLETVPDELLSYLEPLSKSIPEYIKNANNVIGFRKLIGKNLVDVEGSIETSNLLSINKYIADLSAQGLITNEDIQNITEIMNVLFNNQLGYIDNLVKPLTEDSTYLLAIGQIESVISQIGDYPMMIVYDLFKGQFNFGRLRISPNDINTDETMLDFESSLGKDNYINKIQNKVLTPFQKFDYFNQTVAINNMYRSIIKDVKNNRSKTIQQIENIFGKDKSEQIINDIKKLNGNEDIVSEEMKRILFSELGGIRPITPLQKTTLSVESPMYGVLRTFFFKQLEFIRKNSIDDISVGAQSKDIKKIVTGLGKLSVIVTIFALFGAGKDEILDWLRGKDTGSFKDKIINNLLKTVGSSKYTVEQGEKGNLAKTLINLPFIPSGISILTSTVDDLRTDIKNAIYKNEDILDFKSLKRFPLIGNIFYNRYGGGTARAEKEMSRETKLYNKFNK